MNASGMKFGSREQKVSMISRSLKQLAKELNIPIIALSQLNRSVETRGADNPEQASAAEATSVSQVPSSRTPISYASFTVRNIICTAARMPKVTTSVVWPNSLQPSTVAVRWMM